MLYADDIRQDMNRRDLWSNNLMVAGAVSVVLTILMTVVNETGSLFLFALVGGFLVLSATAVITSLIRWAHWRKKAQSKLAHSHWMSGSL